MEIYRIISLSCRRLNMATINLGPLNFNKVLTYSNYTITAGSGNDILDLTGNNDILQFGAGNDTITVHGDNVNITATSGNDNITIVGGATAGGPIGTDTVNLGSGNNTIDVNAINDHVNVTVGSGHNIIRITASAGGDIIKAGGGGNYIYAAGSANSITSGAGNDTLVYNPSSVLEDAGAGFNTLLVTAHVPEIYFDGTIPLNFKNFQLIDLTGTGMADLSGFANTLDLSPSAVDQITGTAVNDFNGHKKTLVVLPSYSDHINIGSGWTNVTPSVESPLHATENLVVGNTITPTTITLAEYRVYTKGQDTLIINEAPPLANPDNFGPIIEVSGQHYPLSYSTGNILSNDQSMAGFAFSIKALDGIGLTNGFFFETLADGNTLKLNTDGTFIYTINNPINGSDVFHYTITDGILTSSPGAITFNVQDTAPLVSNDSFGITEPSGPFNPLSPITLSSDNVNVFGLLHNDTPGGGTSFVVHDLDGNIIAVNGSYTETLADGNSLKLNSDGSFLYTIHNPINGPDVFHYTVTDGVLISSQATITFNVTDTAPVASNDAFNVTEPAGPFDPLSPINLSSNNASIFGVLHNDTPGGGASFVVHDLDGNIIPVNGSYTETLADGNSLKLNSDGSFLYTINEPINGSDVFHYTITDGLLTSSQAAITFNVSDTAPVASDDSYTLTQDGSAYSLSENSTNGVLANDTPGGGFPLKVVKSDGSDIDSNGIVVATAHGSVTLYSDGSFTYTDLTAFTGTDSFTYKISDGLLTSTATANIAVTDTVTPVIYGFNGDNWFNLPPFTVHIYSFEFSQDETSATNTWQVNLAPTHLAETYSYTLSDPLNQGILNDFSINSSGLITQVAPLDEAAFPSDLFGNHMLTLGVTVKDTNSGNSTTKDLVIALADADHDNTATLTSNNLTEGNQNDVVVATLSQAHPNGDDVYNTVVSVTDNNNVDVTKFFSLVNGELKIDRHFEFITGPIGGPFTTVYSYLKLDEGSYTYHVTVKDSENDLVTIPLTFTVNEASNEISLVAGANTHGIAYNDNLSRTVFDASSLFQDPYDSIIYSSSDLSSSLGLSIDPSTGVISGALSVSPGNYTVHITASDGDINPIVGSDIVTTTMSIHVAPTFSITSNHQFMFVDDYNNFESDISDFTGSSISVALSAGMPGQILNYFDGTYAYLDWNLATESTGLASSPKFVTGSMTVDNNVYPVRLWVTDPGITLLNQDPTTLLQNKLTASSGTNGGNGGDGYNTGSGLEIVTHAGSAGFVGVGGFSVESVDSHGNIVPFSVTNDNGIIFMPDTGDAGDGGNGGNGGTGAPGWSIFDPGAKGGDGGHGGNGGSILYQLNNFNVVNDQIIIGGDTGNAGFGGVGGSQGATGTTFDAQTLFPKFGGPGGDGGAGGTGGNIVYEIIAGSGNDYIEVGQAGYSAPTASGHAANGIVAYNIIGGAGHDYFVIDHLPTPGVLTVSESLVDIIGGSGDDVFDLKVSYFVNDSNTKGTLSGLYGTLNIAGGSGFNTLILDGSNASLNGLGSTQAGITSNFTDDPTTVFNHIANMDLIDLKGGSSLGLTAAQIDTITAADGNGNHKLYINSESPLTDSVTFKHDSSFQGSGQSSGSTTEHNTTYNIYHIDAHTTLYIQANISHVVVV